MTEIKKMCSFPIFAKLPSKCLFERSFTEVNMPISNNEVEIMKPFKRQKIV